MELNVHRSLIDDCIVFETGISAESAFKLFDEGGNLVLSEKIANGQRLSVHTLRKGFYHYKLVAGERLQVGKIVL